MLREQNPILEKAVNRLVYISADEQLRYELDMREKAELDYWSDLADLVERRNAAIAEERAEGKAEGKAEGRIEGRIEGEAKKSREIAKNMKQLGVETALIAKSTGLSIKEIEIL